MPLPLRILRWTLCAPRFLGWLWPLSVTALRLADVDRVTDDGVLIARWRRPVRWSTTLLAGIVLSPQEPEILARVLEHEAVHVRQFDDAFLLGLVQALVLLAVSGSPLALLAWPAGALSLAVAYLGSLLRGGHIYWDAEHERSAYAQTDDPAWSRQHEERKRR